MSEPGVPSDGAERISAIEDALVAQWSNFGRWTHGRLRDEHGVLWFETPIKNLPYNMVIRTRIPAAEDADAVISEISDGFRQRGVPYVWIVRPTDVPADLDRRLPRLGLDMVEAATGMDMELATWKPEPVRGDASIVPADKNETALEDYLELIRTYWSVPESERQLLEQFNREKAFDNSPGVRLVAYLDGQPVGKLFMNYSESPARVGVYGVSVRPEARGRGVATDLMTMALAQAKDAGVERAVLHSSQMAVTLYRRMGFTDRCQLSVYATGPLFGTHHH